MLNRDNAKSIEAADILIVPQWSDNGKKTRSVGVNMEERILKKRTMAVVAAGVAFGLALGVNAASAGIMKYEVANGGISKSLTDKAGDAKNGRKLAINRKKGNCLACHAMPIPEQQFHGEVGPALNGVASRYSVAEMRLRIVDPKVLNEDTIMPAFYKDSGFHRVHKKFKGKSVLAAQEVEDILAYLTTLK